MSILSSGKSQRQFLVVFNPTTNRVRKRRLAKLITALKERNYQWSLYATEQALHANGAVLRTKLKDVTDLIVVGGDGTFNIVINSLPFDVVSKTVPLRIGLLPAGTGNDFARGWYDPSLTEEALIDIVLSEKTTLMHLGECEMVQSTRLFHNVMGAGFDAMISKELENKKTLFRSLSYLLSALKYIPFYQEPKCNYQSSKSKREYFNLLTAFGNSRYFGGGLPITPDAKATAESIQVVSVPKLPLFTKLHLLTELLKGKHTLSSHIYSECLSEGETAQILTDGLELEADGEFIGYSPCKVSVSDYWLHMKCE